MPKKWGIIYKWDSNIAWYVVFVVFLAVKCPNSDKILFAFFDLTAL